MMPSLRRNQWRSARLAIALAISASALGALEWQRLSNRAEAAGPIARQLKPEISSRPENVSPGNRAGVDITTAWHEGLALRTGACMYDNGAPLDDENHPASQYSDTEGELPAFIAATADDFIFPAGTCGTANAVQVSNIRAAFRFFNTGSETATPLTTFNGIYVSVYPDASNLPGGHPTDPPSPTPGQPMSQTGSVISFQFIPVSSLTNQTLLSACSKIYQIDIPIQFSVVKGTKYWLSLVPKFVATPQSAWALSATGGNLQAVQGLPEAGLPFWTPIAGNSHACPNSPTNGTKRDVSFILTGDETDATGACCTEDTSSCTDGVQQVNCQAANQRFAAGQTCAALNPPCGSGTGACCLSNHTCSVVTLSQCTNMGGAFTSGQPCSPVTCPGPTNDLCADAILVSSAITPFDTTGAFTDGPDETPACPAVNQDIWYKYNATCDGTLTVDLCTGTNFDASLAVYNGCTCPPVTPSLGCDDNSCGGGAAPKVSIPVTNAHCYLIRIGGIGTAVGSGQMTLTCTPSSGGCCKGDANGDGVINDADVQVLADAILVNPAADTPEFCRADVNGDTKVDGLDIAAFITKFLAGTPCEPTGACCHQAGTCDVTTAANCVAAGDVFTAGGTCSPNPCPPPGGACCKTDGSCELLSDSACTSANGTFQGVGTLCSPNPCPSPTGGACCSSDGSCQVLSQNACVSAGGVFHGDSTTCASNPCPPPPGPCAANFVVEIAGTDSAPGDLVGSSVATDGNTAVAGAPNQAGIGAAYIFVQSGGVWTQQAKLTALDSVAGDEFGYSVSISGDTALIGARMNGGMGAVYVFIRAGGVWTQQAKLTALDGAAGDQFGISVAVFSDTALVGASLDDTTGGTDAGSAYVFTRSGATWTQRAKLTASDAAAGDQFGGSVALSGDNAVLGAPLDDNAGGTDAGSVYVFVKPAGGWADATESAKLVASDASSNSDFGGTVTIDGNTVVAGSHSRPGGGAVYVFTGSSNTWTQQAVFTGFDTKSGDDFGFSVNVRGDTMVAGAIGENTGGFAAGAAYAFVRSGGFWYGRGKLLAPDNSNGLNFGTSVSFSQGSIVVGAPNGGVGSVLNSGSSYFYQLVCGNSCCPGDMNNDCTRDLQDIDAFVSAVMAPPAAGSADFCHADMNGDGFVDGRDVRTFVNMVLNSPSCTASCCRGDADGNSVVDGRDIAPFVSAFLAPPPICSALGCRVDVNQDGMINDADLPGFVSALLSGGCAP